MNFNKNTINARKYFQNMQLLRDNMHRWTDCTIILLMPQRHRYYTASDKFTLRPGANSPAVLWRGERQGAHSDRFVRLSDFRGQNKDKKETNTGRAHRVARTFRLISCRSGTAAAAVRRFISETAESSEELGGAVKMRARSSARIDSGPKRPPRQIRVCVRLLGVRANFGCSRRCIPDYFDEFSSPTLCLCVYTCLRASQRESICFRSRLREHWEFNFRLKSNVIVREFGSGGCFSVVWTCFFFVELI